MPVRCPPQTAPADPEVRTEGSTNPPAIAAFPLLNGLVTPASADTFDDIVVTGILRCAVVAEFRFAGGGALDQTVTGVAS